VSTAPGRSTPTRRLNLHGARWSSIEVVAATSSGILIEGPSQPPLEVGAARQIELGGLRGITVIIDTYPAPDRDRAFYVIAVIEVDAGFLASIGDLAATPRTVRVT
jgi:hypothetical protein